VPLQIRICPCTIDFHITNPDIFSNAPVFVALGFRKPAALSRNEGRGRSPSARAVASVFG
jgi:hypothetical protein